MKTTQNLLGCFCGVLRCAVQPRSLSEALWFSQGKLSGEVWSLRQLQAEQSFSYAPQMPPFRSAYVWTVTNGLFCKAK